MPKPVIEPTERATIDSIRLKKDRDTLGVLLSRVKELKLDKAAAEEQLPPLVEQATLLMQGHDIKSIAFQEKYFTVTNGTNVIKADTITKILDMARSIKTYTTLTMSSPKKTEADAGGEE